MGIVGIAKIGGDCGTNRDPQLFEADRQASWAALTKGRKLVEMKTTAQPARDFMPRPWADTNRYYVCGGHHS